MHKIGERLLYGSDGVVEIIDIREESFADMKKKYYVLHSVTERSASETLVPTDSESLLSRMRPLLTKEEAVELIHSVKAEEADDWIEDNRQRQEKFKQVILNGDRKALFRMIHSIHLAGERRLLEGKKNYLSDENAMKKAEKLLYSELSVVLGIPESDVPHVIESI